MASFRIYYFILLLAPFALASDFRVQGPNGPYKSSKTVEIGQRFECLEDSRLVIYDCPILFQRGTVGFRASNSVFFISRGGVRVGALKPAPRIGYPRPPLTFRFFRGALQATGLEWLFVDDQGKVRWYKEANTGLSDIQIDGKSCKGEEGTLLVAEDRQWLVLAPKKGKTFNMDGIRDTQLTSLKVKHRVLREAQASVATRTSRSSYSEGEKHWSRERRKFRATSFQEGQYR
jgi:hypothetical protein